MKRLILLLLAATTLGGCVVVPFDAYYGHRHYYDDGYSRGGYWHDYDRNYRFRDHY
jgi:hypothetical protein